MAFMAVPCCSVLVAMVRKALAQCGRELPLYLVRIGIRGEVVKVNDDNGSML
ncbi:MAG: hypothetical protein PHQ27_05255 [Victivallales bacterium]|nr:hypothetical protein [Victivallales bacterium]